MSYKDRKKQIAYQIAWAKRRRDAWFAENGPCVDCGTWEELELDHVDAKTKVTHKVWGLTEKRRLPELAKCVARCHSCHVRKTFACKEQARGERHGMRHPHARALIAEKIRKLERTPCPYCGKMLQPAGHGLYRHKSKLCAN